MAEVDVAVEDDTVVTVDVAGLDLAGDDEVLPPRLRR